MEIRIGVRELRIQLSRLLSQVKGGQTIIITERGREIGRIIPSSSSLEERMQAMLQAGLADWNGEKLESLTPAAKNRSERQVSDILSEMRE